MDEETIKKIWRQRTAVLNAYPPDEILEIYSSVCFLRGLLEKLMEDELTGTGDEDLERHVEIRVEALVGPLVVWNKQRNPPVNTIEHRLNTQRSPAPARVREYLINIPYYSGSGRLPFINSANMTDPVRDYCVIFSHSPCCRNSVGIYSACQPTIPPNKKHAEVSVTAGWF
ncbi:hypothetical protein B0H13DRAFT_1918767 [Mycena leptocephala]|nr:hypothetical protein B0H13DRAFT_1918767 [Mycena leptocephala]